MTVVTAIIVDFYIVCNIGILYLCWVISMEVVLSESKVEYNHCGNQSLDENVRDPYFLIGCRNFSSDSRNKRDSFSNAWKIATPWLSGFATEIHTWLRSKCSNVFQLIIDKIAIIQIVNVAIQTYISRKCDHRWYLAERKSQKLNKQFTCMSVCTAYMYMFHLLSHFEDTYKHLG